MGKLTNVVLENTSNNTTEEFEINHAERILRMPNNGGWQLPKDSPYKFDTNDGIGIKSNKGGDSKAEQTEGNK